MITKNTKIIDIIEQKPEAINTIARAGLRCLGCGEIAFETLEQGASVHGMGKEDIKKLVDEINKLN